MQDIIEREIGRLKAQLAAGNVRGNFPESLVAQWDQKGSLSDKQLTWVTRLAAEGEEKAGKATHRINADGEYRTLVARFEAAEGERAALHLNVNSGTVVISKAKPNSANPGSLYLKLAGQYLGKIGQNGALREGPCWPDADRSDLIKLLQDLCERFEEAVVEYGRETGSCCLCGALLTNEESVAAGIGPICGGRWGIRKPRQLKCEPEGLAA